MAVSERQGGRGVVGGEVVEREVRREDLKVLENGGDTVGVGQGTKGDARLVEVF